MPRSATALAPLALALACAIGEGGDRPNSTIAVDTETGTGSVGSTGVTTDTGDDGSTLCVPGQQIACPCPGGSEGAQACNAAGTGYEPCECPGADAGSSEGTTTSGDSGDTGIPGECSPDEMCDVCVNCEIEGQCKDQYDACISNAACSESADCTIACGFNQTCVLKCAPADDKEGAQLFNDLSLCLGSACPQCLRGG